MWFGKIAEVHKQQQWYFFITSIKEKYNERAFLPLSSYEISNYL